MSSKLPVTLIIITHRNNTFFESAYACSRFFREVIVVDYNASITKQQLSAISDTPAQLLKKSGYITDFAQARNQAMKHATYDWVFFLDSDETIEDGFQEDFLRIINSDIYAAGSCTRKDIFLGQLLHHGEAVISLARLLNKDAAEYKHAVHETPIINGQTLQTSCLIRHYAHQSIATFFEKVSHYSKLKAATDNDSFLIVILKMLSFPHVKFIYTYLLRLGILDGYRGLIYAIMMSMHSFWVRVYSYENTKSNT